MAERERKYLSEERASANRRNELISEGANLEVQDIALDRQAADITTAKARIADRLKEIDAEVAKLPAPEEG
jgi:hypothetical protein